ncbi:lipid A biosynthesis acyltransferase [Flavobacteriaceae bacterium R38]|nr:lipid A biosynthesis acyltransferase [Flavobacteriaceae bacterium R38]
MQLLIYIITYPFLWFVSILPFKLLYFVSNIVYVFVYKVFGYRRKVVRANLELVFPEKTKEEIITIERRFYSHMCDMFLEMVKTMTISENEMQKRFVFENIEVVQDLEKRKAILMMFPHYASWEWVIAMDKHIESKGYAVYQRLKNKKFDKLIRDIRGKFGTKLIETRETPSTMRDNRQNNIRSIYGVISDQSPALGITRYWSDFMNVKVPVHVGSETLAKRFDLAVIYLKVKKVKRGYYSASFKVLEENPRELDNYKVTDLFLREVEAHIKVDPAYYFWTHKRWKHKDRVPEEFK